MQLSVQRPMRCLIPRTMNQLVGGRDRQVENSKIDIVRSIIYHLSSTNDPKLFYACGQGHSSAEVAAACGAARERRSSNELS